MGTEPHKWTCEQVGEWLEKIGFEDYMTLFVDSQKIDGLCLLQLTEKDLKEPPLSIPKIGDIKRMVTQIYKLKVETVTKHPHMNESIFRDQEYILDEALRRRKFKSFTRGKKANFHASIRQSIDTNSAYNEVHTRAYTHEPYTLKPNVSSFLKPEFFKLLVAFLYLMFAGLMTTFVMVVVHDRVPNMEVYPPLPDIVLDNVPYMPWAFKACEAIIVFFGGIIIFIVIFHKHRCIIARRLFAMSGTVFLLRCVTMLITSLSVPGTHLQCEPRGYHTMTQRVNMALKIFGGLGMSIQGVRTCGDYLFSGHTVVVTISNFFINEYTSRKFSALHTLGWVGNFFAIFFILAAHEHYSIDVFIAFYITSRLFLYYHSLANNKFIMQRDSRTQVWFPLFSYFEASIDGRVPNEFEPIWITFYNYIHPDPNQEVQNVNN